MWKRCNDWTRVWSIIHAKFCTVGYFVQRTVEEVLSELYDVRDRPTFLSKVIFDNDLPP